MGASGSGGGCGGSGRCATHGGGGRFLRGGGAAFELGLATRWAPGGSGMLGAPPAWPHPHSPHTHAPLLQECRRRRRSTHPHSPLLPPSLPLPHLAPGAPRLRSQGGGQQGQGAITARPGGHNCQTWGQSLDHCQSCLPLGSAHCDRMPGAHQRSHSPLHHSRCPPPATAPTPVKSWGSASRGGIHTKPAPRGPTSGEKSIPGSSGMPPAAEAAGAGAGAAAGAGFAMSAAHAVSVASNGRGTMGSLAGLHCLTRPWYPCHHRHPTHKLHPHAHTRTRTRTPPASACAARSTAGCTCSMAAPPSPAELPKSAGA